jgi:hypothetical protein
MMVAPAETLASLPLCQPPLSIKCRFRIIGEMRKSRILAGDMPVFHQYTSAE